MPLFTPAEQHALLLSTLAGLSTGVGGAIAIIKRPGPGLLSLLLGVAIGVMATLSVIEMWLHNAYEHGPLSISAAAAGGGALYFLLQPYFPDFESTEAEKREQDKALDKAAGIPASATAEALVTKAERKDPVRKPQSNLVPTASGKALRSEAAANGAGTATATLDAPASPAAPVVGPALSKAGVGAMRPSELLRLGCLMALTMTLHNLPEGFAVAFSALTDFGAIMAVAIAVHNIPEGVIVAAPVYAATGSRWKAMAIAVASGLSEPVGALIALLVVKPFLTPGLLQHMLAFTGGIMMAVCVLELWPEARKCGEDTRLWQGIILGSVVMAWTLYIGI